MNHAHATALPWTPARTFEWEAHYAPLLAMVLGALLLYAYTTARYGHALGTADAHLYYTHAHSWYFDGDCDYANNLLGNPKLEVRNFYLAQQSATGRTLNIFPAGWSVLAFPFLALADAATLAHNAISAVPLPRDGHSAYYRAIVPLAHVLVGIGGMLAAYALAARFVEPRLAAWSMFFVWLATNSGYFVSIEPTMAHAAGLGLVCVVVLMTDTILRNGCSARRSAVLGLCAGLMVAVRHQDAVWLAVPLVALLLAPRRHDRHMTAAGMCIPAVALFALCLVPQVLVNLAIHGTISSRLASFAPDWLHPRLARDWLTPPSGMLWQFPLTALCLLGAIAGAWRCRAQALVPATAVSFAAFTYLNACSATGPSRRFASCTFLFVLGLAAVLHWSARARWRHAAVAALILGACVQNVLLLYRVDRGLVHREVFTG